MSETITCPSGLTARIRGMKAREERILADRKLARSGSQLEQILAACWEETLDSGPYDFGEQPIEWARSSRATASSRSCACACSPTGPITRQQLGQEQPSAPSLPGSTQES